MDHPHPAAEWRVIGHFDTPEGDRTSLLELNGQWAVLFSYAPPFSGGVQLLAYPGEGSARRTFRDARSNALRRHGALSPDRYDKPADLEPTGA